MCLHSGMRVGYLNGLCVIKMGTQVHEELWHPRGHVIGAGEDASTQPQHPSMAPHQVCTHMNRACIKQVKSHLVPQLVTTARAILYTYVIVHTLYNTTYISYFPLYDVSDERLYVSLYIRRSHMKTWPSEVIKQRKGKNWLVVMGTNQANGLRLCRRCGSVPTEGMVSTTEPRSRFLFLGRRVLHRASKWLCMLASIQRKPHCRKPLSVVAAISRT